MEQNNPNADSSQSPQGVQDSNVTQVRDNVSPGANPVGTISSGANPVAPFRDALQPGAQDVVQKGASFSGISSYRQQYSQVNFASEQSLNLVETFDPNYTGVQPCEFYVFNDPILKSRGYF